jgi:hypothetical protein
MRAKVAARRHPVVKVKTGHGPGHLLASIQPGALVHAIANVDAGGSMPVFSGIAKVAGRGLKDAEEMAVTTPSSVAKLASDAVHHPERVPGELAKPYVQLAKHPIKTLSEHPLQTALMVAPAVRMPGRTLGKVARVAGKQTLERPPAALPGTALKVARTGSRDAVVRAFQSRADRKAPAPVATVKDVQTRVDEFHDMAQHHTHRVVASATKQAKRAAKGKGLSKADQRVVVREKVEGARGGAHNQTDAKFVREFGAVHEITPQGHIVKPKGATEGVLHDTHDTAQRIATASTPVPRRCGPVTGTTRRRWSSPSTPRATSSASSRRSRGNASSARAARERPSRTRASGPAGRSWRRSCAAPAARSRRPSCPSARSGSPARASKLGYGPLSPAPARST